MEQTRIASVTFLVACFLGFGSLGRAELFEFPDKPADTRLSSFRKSIQRLHGTATKSSKPWTEESLRKQLPKNYLSLESSFLKIREPKKKAAALAQLALLYSELAWVERIEPIRGHLKELDGDLLDQLGYFEESDHFLVRVVGVDPKWAKSALKLAEAAHQGHIDLFGFDSISKVAGKKIRILIRVDPDIAKPRLYYHPTPLFHSEMRYEMPDEKFLTLAGRNRIVYGFCHEMGHMTAMWGKHGVVEDDKHAWGHYTGCMVVEKVYDALGNEPWPGWTAYQRQASGIARLKKQIEGHKPGTGSYESVLSLFYAIGDEFGTETYGKAWVWLEKNKRFRNINSVSYLWLRDLKDALFKVLDRDDEKQAKELFGKS